MRNAYKNDLQTKVREKVAQFQAVIDRKTGSSLEIVVSITTLASLVSKKVWQTLPSGSDVVRDWIQAVLNIWGSMAVAEGFSVTCIYKSANGTSEIFFNAMNAQEAGTKVMQFVQVSAD